MAFRWCPAFCWGSSRKHLHECCMTDQHKGDHFCSCGFGWS